MLWLRWRERWWRSRSPSRVPPPPRAAAGSAGAAAAPTTTAAVGAARRSRRPGPPTPRVPSSSLGEAKRAGVARTEIARVCVWGVGPRCSPLERARVGVVRCAQTEDARLLRSACSTRGCKPQGVSREDECAGKGRVVRLRSRSLGVADGEAPPLKAGDAASVAQKRNALAHAPLLATHTAHRTTSTQVTPSLLFLGAKTPGRIGRAAHTGPTSTTPLNRNMAPHAPQPCVFASKVQQLLAVVEASGFALQQDGKVRGSEGAARARISEREAEGSRRKRGGGVGKPQPESLPFSRARALLQRATPATAATRHYRTRQLHPARACSPPASAERQMGEACLRPALRPPASALLSPPPTTTPLHSKPPPFLPSNPSPQKTNSPSAASPSRAPTSSARSWPRAAASSRPPPRPPPRPTCSFARRPPPRAGSASSGVRPARSRRSRPPPRTTTPAAAARPTTTPPSCRATWARPS